MEEWDLNEINADEIDPDTGEWQPRQPKNDLLVFASEGEFWIALHENGLAHSSPYFTEFYNRYENLSGGCGCTKKRRIEEVKESYLKLKDLPEPVQVMFRAQLDVKVVRLEHEGNLIITF